MTPDWLDDLLDREPGEPVPEGFAQRLRARLAAEEGGADVGDPEAAAAAPSAAPATIREEAPILRPRFGRLVSVAAGALLLLGVGYWLGRGGNAIQPGSVDPSGPVVASADADEVLELYENRDFYGSIELLTDSKLELGLSDYTVGSYLLDEDEQ